MAAIEDGNTFQPGDHIQRRRFGALAAKELAVGPIDLSDFCHGTLPKKNIRNGSVLEGSGLHFLSGFCLSFT